jgi:hypothetical protein
MARSTGLHEIVRIDDPRARVIQARGELDAESGAELRKALTAAMAEGRVNIVLDLTEVVFMDSTAVRRCSSRGPCSHRSPPFCRSPVSTASSRCTPAGTPRWKH